MSAQDSEHLNKIFKDIEHCISDHRRVDGSDLNMETHFTSRCFRPFVFERGTKVEALRLGLLNKHGKLVQDAGSASLRLLPTGSACMMCGLDKKSSQHQAICGHPLWPLIEDSIERASLHPKLRDLLSNDAAREQLVPAEDDEKPKVERLKRPAFSAQKEARAIVAVQSKQKAKASVPKPALKRSAEKKRV